MKRSSTENKSQRCRICTFRPGLPSACTDLSRAVGSQRSCTATGAGGSSATLRCMTSSADESPTGPGSSWSVWTTGWRRSTVPPGTRRLRRGGRLGVGSRPIPGGIPNSVAIGGTSAGGNLAAAAAIRCRDAGGPRLSLQVLMYPALDSRMSTRSYREFANGPVSGAPQMRWYWQQYIPDQRQWSNPLASPSRTQPT